MDLAVRVSDGVHQCELCGDTKPPGVANSPKGGVRGRELMVQGGCEVAVPGLFPRRALPVPSGPARCRPRPGRPSRAL